MGRNKQIVKWALYVCLMLVVFVLQTTVLTNLRFMGVHANLMPVVVAVVAMFEGMTGGAGMGFMAGLLCDALIPPSEAFFTLYLLISGLLIGKLCDVYFRKRLLAAFIWSLTALAIQGLAYFAVFYLVTGRAGAEALYEVARNSQSNG
jgi:uncharacterized membrane protein